MTDDLRARLKVALAPHIHNGHLVDAEIDNVIEAVMPVVEERLFRARNWDYGKCRWCRAIVSENLAKGLGKQVQPHRMTCRFYLGPVEHSRTGGGHQMLMHWATHCTCGESYDAEKYDECPNSAETWRGPKPEDAP